MYVNYLSVLQVIVFTYTIVPIVATNGNHSHPGNEELSFLSRGKRLSVLLVPVNAIGHLTRMAALGEELVRRGHNVTLCVTEREGDDHPQQLADATGMTLLRAGPDSMPTVNSYRSQAAALEDVDISKAAYQALQQTWSSGRHVADKLMSNPSYSKSWDIVVVDELVEMEIGCVSQMWNVPTISLMTTLDYYIDSRPKWPYPSITALQSDKMTFMQRFEFAFVYIRDYLIQRVFYYQRTSQSNVPTCRQYRYHTRGFFPTILTSAFGFEFPRPVLPNVHYVGPLLLKPQTIASEDLNAWLMDKPEKSVIYISMGSCIHLTIELGNAIVGFALKSNYSILWSLRESNRDFLKGLSIDTTRICIMDWVPQQDALRNKAIKLAVLHGGMGGVGEALYNGVPVVAIPFMFDQYGVAARVQQARAGVYIEKQKLTSDTLISSIETVANSTTIQEGARKLQKIFHHAGGVERAVDLVEFYQDVGYDHLVPAYLKYEWSWVQYYNADVYLLLSILILALIFLVRRLCYCCYSLCTRKTKTE